jgi:hypothetical protein
MHYFFSHKLLCICLFVGFSCNEIIINTSVLLPRALMLAILFGPFKSNNILKFIFFTTKLLLFSWSNWVFYKRRKCLPFASAWVHPGFFVGSVLVIFLVFSVVLILLFAFVLCLLCQMLPLSLWIVHSSLHLVFSGLSILDYTFSFLWIVHSWLHLRFSLDCPFLITPSVFSGLSILDYTFGFLFLYIFKKILRQMLSLLLKWYWSKCCKLENK